MQNFSIKSSKSLDKDELLFGKVSVEFVTPSIPHPFSIEETFFHYRILVWPWREPVALLWPSVRLILPRYFSNAQNETPAP